MPCVQVQWKKSWKHSCRLDSLIRFRMLESCSSGTFSSIGVLWRTATFQAQVEVELPIVAWPKDVFSEKRCGNSFCRANADFDGIQLSYPTAIHNVRIDVDAFCETSSLYPSGSVLWQQEVKAFLKGLRLGEKWKLDTKPMVQMVSNNVQQLDFLTQRTKVNQVVLLWTHSGYAFYSLRKDIPFPFNRTSTKPEIITSSECLVQKNAQSAAFIVSSPTFPGLISPRDLQERTPRRLGHWNPSWGWKFRELTRLKQRIHLMNKSERYFEEMFGKNMDRSLKLN